MKSINISKNLVAKVNNILSEKLNNEIFNIILSIYKKEKAKIIIYKFFEKIYEKRKKNKDYIKNKYEKFICINCDDCHKNFIIEKKDFLMIHYDCCADSLIGHKDCCFKYCCPGGCLRKLKCGHKMIIDPYILMINDGIVNCNICQCKTKLYYCWTGISVSNYKKKI
jgi:hypothetical protein